MRHKTISSAAAAALALVMLAAGGCQSQDRDSSARAASDREPAHSMRTPEGDRLDQPIPYPHYPYDIERGGGGGTSR